MSRPAVRHGDQQTEAVEVVAGWFAMTPSGPGIPDDRDRALAADVLATLRSAGYRIERR